MLEYPDLPLPPYSENSWSDYEKEHDRVEKINTQILKNRRHEIQRRGKYYFLSNAEVAYLQGVFSCENTI